MIPAIEGKGFTKEEKFSAAEGKTFAAEVFPFAAEIFFSSLEVSAFYAIGDSAAKVDTTGAEKMPHFNAKRAVCINGRQPFVG